MIYFIIVMVFLFIILIVNQFLKDPNLKIAYWLLMFLFFISISNIYLSIIFYKKIRNEPGLIGPDGNSGDTGMNGSDGVCTLSTSCGISNCKLVIESELIKIFPIYKKIKSKLKRNIVLSGEEKKALNKINSYIDILLPVCESGKFNKKEFLDHIYNSV